MVYWAVLAALWLVWVALAVLLLTSIVPVGPLRALVEPLLFMPVALVWFGLLLISLAASTVFNLLVMIAPMDL